MRLSSRRYLRLPKSATPPDMSVAEAALLVFAEIGPAATGATLLELAQLGVVRIDAGETEQGQGVGALLEVPAPDPPPGPRLHLAPTCQSPAQGSAAEADSDPPARPAGAGRPGAVAQLPCRGEVLCLVSQHA